MFSQSVFVLKIKSSEFFPVPFTWGASSPLEKDSPVGSSAEFPEFLDPHRVSTEVTLGRGDLSVRHLEGFTGARECVISTWRSVPQGSPQGQTLRALLLRGCNF